MMQLDSRRRIHDGTLYDMPLALLHIPLTLGYLSSRALSPCTRFVKETCKRQDAVGFKEHTGWNSVPNSPSLTGRLPSVFHGICETCSISSCCVSMYLFRERNMQETTQLGFRETDKIHTALPQTPLTPGSCKTYPVSCLFYEPVS